jgi:hypothetical protein
LSLKDFGGDPPEGGWGIYFKDNNTKYTIFGDLDNNKTCESSCVNPSSEKKIEVKILNDLKIEDISIGSVTNLIFIPPDPEISICRNNDNQCNYNDFVITLEGGSKITVNKYGMVDVD